MGTERVSVLIWGCSSLTTASVLNVLDSTKRFDVVGCVRNWDELVDITYRLMPSVLLFDIDHDENNSLSVLADFKKEFQHCPVLAISLNEDDRRALSALAAGANGFCLSWRLADRISAALEAVAGGGAWMDSALTELAHRADEKVRQCQQMFDGRKLAHIELTSREQQVLQSMMSGLSKLQVAERLSISIEEVLSNEMRIRQKFDFPDGGHGQRYDAERK